MSDDENKLDPSFYLSEEDQGKVKQWLDAKWTGNKSCQICGHQKWAVDDVMVVSPVLSPTRGINLGRMVVWIVVHCMHCKYSLLFNAALMGITTAQPSLANNDVSRATGSTGGGA